MMKARIGTRILAGFGIVTLVTLVAGWHALFKLGEVVATATEMQRRDSLFMEHMSNLRSSEERLAAVRETAHRLYLESKANPRNAGTAAAMQEEWRRSRGNIEKSFTDLEAVVSQFQSNALHPQRSAKWREIGSATRQLHESFGKLTAEASLQLGLMQSGDWSQLAGRDETINGLRRAFESEMAATLKHVREQLELGDAMVAASHREATLSIGAAMALALGLSLASGLFLYRSIAPPLRLFMQFAEGVGQGDLTQQAQVRGGDELAKLAETLNQMAAGLRDVASQTRRASENLNAATTEIMASTKQQAASSAEQASAVQQTSATMGELTQSGVQISDRAKQVAASAEGTSAASKAGLQAVQNTVRTMETIREQAEALAENVVGLSEKTQAVGEIITTVNDIAEQSHLLALNAAIEAAAAGDHGRSFTVVASEMKALADQCREATLQVRSILGEIQKGINSSVMLTEEAVKRVESGKQHSEIADATIRQMADSIQESVQAFQQIVAGANQQQIGFEQVVQAIRGISQATSQTAAGTQQTERAAANVNALSQQMQKAVERYKV